MKTIKTKHSFRLITAVTVLLAALTAPVQRGVAGAGDDQTHHTAPNGVSRVEKQLKLLSEKLELTRDQRAKIKPILQELQDAVQKFMKDETTTSDERIEKMRTWHEKADKHIRKLLNDGQQKKLDQLESEPHPELHGE